MRVVRGWQVRRLGGQRQLHRLPSGFRSPGRGRQRHTVHGLQRRDAPEPDRPGSLLSVHTGPCSGVHGCCAVHPLRCRQDLGQRQGHRVWSMRGRQVAGRGQHVLRVVRGRQVRRLDWCQLHRLPSGFCSLWRRRQRHAVHGLQRRNAPEPDRPGGLFSLHPGPRSGVHRRAAVHTLRYRQDLRQPQGYRL